MPASIEAGLCGHCRWAQRIESARGSEFLRCRRSDDDPSYRKYPQLPVLTCAGFQTDRPAGAPPLPRRAPGARPEVPVTNPNEPLFARLGGREGVERIVDRFYDLVEADPELRPLFPADMTAGREKQKWFFEQWLGGEFRYTERFGHPRLRRRHFPFVIDQKAAGRWLRHFNQALQDNGVTRSDIEEIMGALGPLAHHMVNAHEDVPREPLGDVRLS
ncbi:MAG: truncated hemoglobin [Dehalococcoidia bacterium]